MTSFSRSSTVIMLCQLGKHLGTRKFDELAEKIGADHIRDLLYALEVPDYQERAFTVQEVVRWFCKHSQPTSSESSESEDPVHPYSPPPAPRSDGVGVSSPEV